MITHYMLVEIFVSVGAIIIRNRDDVSIIPIRPLPTIRPARVRAAGSGYRRDPASDPMSARVLSWSTETPARHAHIATGSVCSDRRRKETLAPHGERIKPIVKMYVYDLFQDFISAGIIKYAGLAVSRLGR